MFATSAIAVASPARAAVPPSDPTVYAVAFTFVPGDDTLHDDLGDTDTLVISQGQPLRFANLDQAAHDITADAGPSGDTAFQSGKVNVSNTLQMDEPVPVRGVELLLPGRYAFHCSVHDTAMRGVLVIQ